VLNTAAAPFDGSPFRLRTPENAADPEGLLPYPQVLQSGVAGEPVSRVSIPRQLATDYRGSGGRGARRRASARDRPC